ncbi:MAG: serine hydrolase [Lactobacillaceae bacterium]|nr:serine hydrolase [Lactobacillaceae bacterium]
MEQYQETINQLNAMVDEGIVPGMTYLIFDGKQEWMATRGWAQLEPTREKLRPGMLFDLASLTKVIGTVPVIAMLIQEGQLHLDDPVQKYLPEFNDDRPTIRNLLTHTSGIHGYIPHRNELSAEQLKKAFLTQQTVDSTLNRQIRYADVNYLYLGWIIERFCNQPVQEVISQRVLKPLGMTTATFHPEPAAAVPTEIQQGRGLIRGQVHDPKGYILGEHCGCAGLFASLRDLAIFGRQLVENNLGGLLDNKLLDAMFKDQTLIPGPHSRSLGWKLLHDRHDGHPLISHTGFTGTWMILDRQNDQGFILLSNRVHPTAHNQKYLDQRDQIYATYLREKD